MGLRIGEGVEISQTTFMMEKLFIPCCYSRCAGNVPPRPDRARTERTHLGCIPREAALLLTELVQTTPWRVRSHVGFWAEVTLQRLCFECQHSTPERQAGRHAANRCHRFHPPIELC